MTRNGSPDPRARFKRGAAMSEMVLVLPVLVTILVLLFFLGQGLARVERATILARYEAWRSAARAPGPRPDTTTDHAELNEVFLGNAARRIRHGRGGGFPPRAVNELARRGPSRAAALTRELARRREAGRRATVRVRFEPLMPVTAGLEREIRREHVRIGHDWRTANGWTRLPSDDPRRGQWPGHPGWYPAAPRTNGSLAAAAAAFWPTMDQRFAPSRGELSGMLGNAYRGSPGYTGPFVVEPP